MLLLRYMKTQKNNSSMLLFKLHVTDVANPSINDYMYFKCSSTCSILDNMYDFVRGLYPSNTIRLTFKKL